MSNKPYSSNIFLDYLRFPLCKPSHTLCRFLTILTRKGFLAYLVLVAPLSVVRFMQFNDIDIGSGGVLAVASLFALTGFVDVILFIGAGPAFGVNFDR